MEQRSDELRFAMFYQYSLSAVFLAFYSFGFPLFAHSLCHVVSNSLILKLPTPGIPAVTKSSNFDHLQQDLDLFSWNFTAQDTKLGLEQALCFS